MRLIRTCLTLLLVCGAAASHAGQRMDGWAWSSFRLRSIAAERSDKQGDAPAPRAGEPRRDRIPVFPESSGSSGSSGGQESSAAAADHGRRSSRNMSPEERRALRRQIDEVGHDIYSPKR
jgi:hypothetical protein